MKWSRYTEEYEQIVPADKNDNIFVGGSSPCMSHGLSIGEEDNDNEEQDDDVHHVEKQSTLCKQLHGVIQHWGFVFKCHFREVRGYILWDDEYPANCRCVTRERGARKQVDDNEWINTQC